MASSHRYGHGSADRSAERISETSSSRPAHSLDTRLLLIDSTPISAATSSTFLVDMPATHMSQIAEASAVSVRDHLETRSSGK